MPYCPKCGTRLPRDEEARFCPNCGAPLTPRLSYEKTGVTRVEARKERKIAVSKSRIMVMAVVMVLCLAVSSLGALAKVEPSEAEDIVQEMGRMGEMLEVAGVQIIFGNNLMHCLIMFVPVLGPFYGSYVLYSTGKVLAAMGSVAGADPLVLFVSLFVFPHAWMEYISYSIAISESLWLVYILVRHGLGGFRNELTTASKAVAICAVLLLLAAFAEVLLISSVQT